MRHTKLTLSLCFTCSHPPLERGRLSGGGNPKKPRLTRLARLARSCGAGLRRFTP